jgi:hypothetical protein
MVRQNRVQEEWLSYREAVVPSNASSVQLQECRRAFYGGAHAILQRIVGSLTPGGEPEPSDLRMMDEIEAELQDFLERVKRGLA